MLQSRIAAHAGQSSHAVDDLERCGRSQDHVSPAVDGLVLQSDPGCVADEPVGMVEVREREVDSGFGIGLLGVKAFQLLAQVVQMNRCGVLLDGGFGRFRTGVDHAIEFGLCASSSNGEAERPVGRDHHIGQRQWRPRQEFFLSGGVARTTGSDVNGVHRAECPVANIQSILVLGGELGAVAEGDSHRATGANVDQLGQAVEEVPGPLAGPAAPAELTAADSMRDARRAVPR